MNEPNTVNHPEHYGGENNPYEAMDWLEEHAEGRGQ